MYSREQYEKAFELRKNGYNYTEIAKIIEAKTPGVVYGWIKKDQHPQGKFLDINFDKMSLELAYVLGTVEGDGYLKVKPTKGLVGLEVKDKDFALYFKNQIEKWSGLKTSFRIRKDSGRFFVTLFVVVLHSLRAAQFINNIDIYSLSNFNHKIKSSFLKGLFDSEGSVSGSNLDKPRIATRFIAFFNNNLKLIYLVRDLLESLGIKVQNIDTRTGIGFKKSGINYRLRIGGKENLQKFRDKVGFSIQRKNKKLEDILKSYVTK